MSSIISECRLAVANLDDETVAVIDDALIYRAMDSELDYFLRLGKRKAPLADDDKADNNKPTVSPEVLKAREEALDILCPIVRGPLSSLMRGINGLTNAHIDRVRREIHARLLPGEFSE